MSDDCFGDLAGVKLPVALSAADVRSSFPRPTRDAKVDAGYCAQEELTTACLPTLVLVGVQKGGTTEFEHYMGLSEQIFAPGGETAWFHKHSDAYDRDMAKKLPITPPWWHYVAHRFNMSRIMSSHGSRHYRVIFEKMAMFVTPSVVRNIRSILPSAVLILLMREPGARAQSHFQHVCRKGKQPWNVVPCSPESFDRLLWPRVAAPANLSRAFPLALEPLVPSQLEGLVSPWAGLHPDGMLLRGLYSWQLRNL